MVKHNNVVPNQHFHKDWQQRVRVTLDQPMRKRRRRAARKAKAEAIAPRPVSGLLRPAVHCPTQRYNSKIRAGRGFTLEELKEVGINRLQARSIGIAVDFRRRNKAVESLQLNVQRLKAYQAKLIVFPRKAGKIKKGDSSAADTKNATQHTGELVPIVQAKNVIDIVTITADMKKYTVKGSIKQALATFRLEGKRRMAKDEEEDDKKKK